MIAVVDYGMGNLRSVQKALEHLGQAVVLASDAQTLATAGRVVLPGVGAFRDAIGQLEQTGLKSAILDYVQSGRPVLGICLGMQLLFETSHEFGTYAGLGLMDGVVERLPDAGGSLKIPHMGWNSVRAVAECPLLHGLDGADFYFVHSYAVGHSACAVGMTEYGDPFVSVVQRGAVSGTQFHPEKCGDAGLELYRNWLKAG